VARLVKRVVGLSGLDIDEFSAHSLRAGMMTAAVALHTTPGIPEHMYPEIALVQAGAAMDVVGRGYHDLTDEQREAVIAAYPRGSEFKHEMIEAFYQGIKHRPDSTFGTFNDDFLAFKDPNFRRGDLCRIILGSH